MSASPESEVGSRLSGPTIELLNQGWDFSESPGDSFVQQSLRSIAPDRVSVMCHESVMVLVTGYFLLPQDHFLGVWPVE